MNKDNKKGKIVFLEDMDYKSWVNRNTALVEEIISTGRISTRWLQKDQNKQFLIRRLHELGYSINID